MKFRSFDLTIHQRGKIEIYAVSFDINDRKDAELISRARAFSQKTKEFTYKRSKMSENEHEKNIMIGKLAEIAFTELAWQLFRLELKVNYGNKVDIADFILNGRKVDIKSSSLRTKRKDYNLKEALLGLNFTVLKDQSRKDIIVQALYPSRSEFYTFYFSKWAYVREIIRRKEIRKIKMNNAYGDRAAYGYYYVMPLIMGRNIKDLKEVLQTPPLDNQKFQKQIHHFPR